jgi:YebC/PmpR family DNA-binding regulatory protein
MSGHSKWATIHRKKGELDAARGKVFQKIAKEIYVAAKGTNGDPNSNASLRAVIEKARANNMPKDNIEKAIAKAVGGAGDESYESVRYEGYAPGGVAIMIDCLTDNRNRTAMLVRSTLTKKGGNLGTDGSVSYMFERKGVITIPKELDEDTVMMSALDSGALDFVSEDEVISIDFLSTTSDIDRNEGINLSKNTVTECKFEFLNDKVIKFIEFINHLFRDWILRDGFIV